MQETKVAELEAEREEQRLQATDPQAGRRQGLRAGRRWPQAERDARIAGAEAERQEVELQAAANAQRVKVEAAAEAERVKLAAGAEAEHVQGRRRAPAPSRPAPSARPRPTATQAKGMAEGEAVRAKGMAEAEAIKARADALAENQDAVIGQQLAEQWPAIVEAAAKPFGDIDQMIVLNGAQGLSDALAQALSQGVAGLQMARNLLSGANQFGVGSNGSGTNGRGDSTGAGHGMDDQRARRRSARSATAEIGPPTRTDPTPRVRTRVSATVPGRHRPGTWSGGAVPPSTRRMSAR